MNDKQKWTVGVSVVVPVIGVAVGVIGQNLGADAAATVVGGVLAAVGVVVAVIGQFFMKPDPVTGLPGEAKHPDDAFPSTEETALPVGGDIAPAGGTLGQAPAAEQAAASEGDPPGNPAPESDSSLTGPVSTTGSAVPTQAELKGHRDYDVETWADSAERIAHFARRRLVYVTAGGGALMALSGVVLLETYRSGFLVTTSGRRGGHFEHLSGALILTIGAVVLVFSSIPYFSARAAFRTRKAATAGALVDRAIRNVTRGTSGDDLLPLPGLFELNRRQLDAYQQTTRRQQRLAFLLTQVASVIAFLVLIAGIVLAFAAHTRVEKYISGGLSGLGTVLSVFLAKTFFISQKDANAQMNRYYLEPQRTGRLLAAERAVEKIRNAKDAALLADIVTAVLAWEMPTETEATTDSKRTDSKRTDSNSTDSNSTDSNSTDSNSTDGQPSEVSGNQQLGQTARSGDHSKASPGTIAQFRRLIAAWRGGERRDAG